MMAAFTWLAVLILGPGSLAIFAWFLATLRRTLASRESRPEQELPAAGVNEKSESSAPDHRPGLL